MERQLENGADSPYWAWCLAITGLPYPWQVLDVTYGGEDFTNRVFRFHPGQVISGVLVRVEQRETAAALTAECQR